MNTVNPANHPDLDAKMIEIESEIRNNFSEAGRASIRKLPAMQAYAAYYRKFKKTYHVQLQIESVAFKNRNLPRISALVSQQLPVFQPVKKLLFCDISALLQNDIGPQPDVGGHRV